MLVVDTSALLDSIVVGPAHNALRARMAEGGSMHAPHLIDLEALGVVRRWVMRGDVDETLADRIVSDLADVAIVRYSHVPLRSRIWRLRNNLTVYDAAYVTLAEILEAPLVTTDGRLARATGHRAEIELFSPLS